MAMLGGDFLGKQAPKKGFFSKLGSASLGFLAGIAGIVAYPVAFTVSEAAIGMRNYKTTDSVLVKAMKGIGGFIWGAGKGLGRGILQGFGGLGALPYQGWHGKLGETLTRAKNYTVNAVSGRHRQLEDQIQRTALNSDIDYDIQPSFHRTQPLPDYPDDDYEIDIDPSKSVIFSANATIRERSASTTFPGTMTLISNNHIHPSLTTQEIANIRKQIKSGNNTFALLDNHASFTGPDPAEALIKCQSLASFQIFQKTASYQLTLDIPDNADNIKKVCEYLESCHSKGINIKSCRIGGQDHRVIPPNTLAAPEPSSSSSHPANS